MAGRSDGVKKAHGRFYEEHPQLRPFALTGVSLTGREIGAGTWCRVVEVDVEGFLCVGRNFHNILIEYGHSSQYKAFLDQCLIVAGLRHPHLVQFIGMSLDSSAIAGRSPLVVIEYLPYCLEVLLEGRNKVNLPVAMKYSILCDVAHGLVYLHTRTPPVVHCNVTAGSIFLTTAMTAKIGDVELAGVNKLRCLPLTSTWELLEAIPHYVRWLPPEVFDEHFNCSPAIDIFFFGCLTLLTMVQEFPEPTLSTMPDPKNPRRMIGLTEVQRRSKHMTKLSKKLGGEGHPLIRLVTQCLDNNPVYRASAREVLSQLNEMKAHFEDQYNHMSKLDLIQLLQAKKQDGVSEGELRRSEEKAVNAEQRATEALERASHSEEQVQQLQRQIRDTTARVSVAEEDKRHGEQRATDAEQQSSQAERRASAAERQASEAEQRATQAERRATQAEAGAQFLHQQTAHLELRAQQAEQRAERAEERLRAVPPSDQERQFWMVQRSEIKLTSRKLGRGGWAEVWVAKFRGLKVAAKCMDSIILSPYNRRLFIREMNIAAAVRHPNLVLFLGATMEGNPVILMELMPANLREILGQGSFNSQQIKDVSIDVARALVYLHSMQPQPIIHRDISSANVLLEPGPRGTWKAKVSDYGSANFLQELNTVGPGNPAYAAPEVNTPAHQSPKMDVYSYGVLLLEICSRQFPSKEEREDHFRRVGQPPVAALIRQCTEEDPQQRRAMHEVLEQLEALPVSSF